MLFRTTAAASAAAVVVLISSLLPSPAAADSPAPAPARAPILLPTGHREDAPPVSPVAPPVPDSSVPSWPVWVDGRWHTEDGSIWIEERSLWWNPGTGLYYVRGLWRTGSGLYWDAASGQWRMPVIDETSSHRTPGPALGAGVERWRPLVELVFPALAADSVLRIMACESGGDPNATSRLGAQGLMQIMPRWHQAKADALFGPGASLYDPVVNLTVAAVISGNGSSWAAWDCRYVLR